ncbi:acyltransferase [Gordonia sp. 'Campus']|uniref:acyltransferase n=1 Tax=Gordonia sp. 'Campus' TaxID=2915824 RepID=UPI001EE497C3|nr:acyltransferase [Gordonia sp. 'Campus']
MPDARQRGAFAPEFSESGSLIARLGDHLVGGYTVEWGLRDPERVGAESVHWDTGVSFLQSDHLTAMEAVRGHGRPHTGFIVAAARFDIPLVDEAMAAALTDFVRRHEELRSHYRSGPAGPQRWVAPPEVFEIVTAETQPRFLDHDDLGDWVGRRASENARADEIPGSWWGAAANESGFTFFYATDHAHGDGYSCVLAVAEIAALYRGHRTGVPPELEAAGSFGDAVLAERRAAVALDPGDDRISVWREALGINDGRAPRCPMELGLTDDQPEPSVSVDVELLDEQALASCDARLGITGGGFSGLIFAALARRHHEMTGDKEFFVSTVLATRAPENTWTQGWLCNFAPVVVDIPSGEDTSFDSLIRTATGTMRSARRAAGVPAHAALAQLAAEGAFRGLDGSPYMVSYTDLRRLPVAGDPVVASMQMFSALGHTRNANLWFTRSASGLAVQSQIPDNGVARAAIVEHLGRVAEILTEYAREGDSR